MPSMILHEAIRGKTLIDPFKVALKNPGLCPFSLITAICNFKRMKHSKTCKEVTPLMIAVYMGCLELVKYLIEEGADVNKGNIDGASALFWALNKGNYEIASILLKSGADVNNVDEGGLTPMYYAIMEDSPTSIVQDLLSHGVSKEGLLGKSGIKKEGRPILKAIIENNVPVVEFLLKQLIQVNYPLVPGDVSPLSQAVLYNCVEGVKLLIKFGAKVNGQDDEGLNPLVAAILKNNVLCVQVLLAAGADIHKAYDWAKIFKSKVVLDDPELSCILDPKIGEYESHVTALHLAVLVGYYGITKELLEAGSHVNKLTGFFKRTPLHLYCFIQVHLKVKDAKSQQTMVQLLLDHKCNMLIKDKNNCTPVMICIVAKFYHLLELFVNAGMDVNADMVMGQSFFVFMTGLAMPNMIKICLDNGGDSARRYKKISVYEGALTFGTDIVKLFFPYHPVDGFSPSALQCHSRRNLMHLNNQYKYIDGIKTNNVNAVRLALRNGAEPRAFLKNMPFPIFCPVVSKNVIMLRILLESGVCPNVQNNKKQTPLHIAAIRRSAECCYVLLKHGACYCIKFSAIQSPKEGGNSRAVINLLKDIHLVFRKAAEGDVIYVKGALKQMPDEAFYSYVNCVNRKGNTLMQEAICSGAPQVAEAVMTLRLSREN